MVGVFVPSNVSSTSQVPFIPPSGHLGSQAEGQRVLLQLPNLLCPSPAKKWTRTSQPLPEGYPETSHGTCHMGMGTVTSYLPKEQRGLAACHTVRRPTVLVGSRHVASFLPSEKP